MRYLAILLAAAAISAPAFLGMALWLAPAPIAAEYWVREMLVVKRAIAAEHQGRRKLVLASGSATLFGIDSAQLGAELGIDAINLGLHAEVLLGTILGEAERAARPGDAVILALEDPYYCRARTSPWQARSLIAWQPETWRVLPVGERIRVLAVLGPMVVPELMVARFWAAVFPSRIAERLQALDDAGVLRRFAAAPPPASFAYSAYHLDRLGNMRATQSKQYSGGPGPSPEIAPAQCGESAGELRAFEERMRARGVAVRFANTPAIDTGNLDPARIARASRELAAALAPYGGLVDTKAEVVLPRRMFFNTYLHLNAEGRAVRTRLLAAAIRRDPELMRHLRAAPSG